MPCKVPSPGETPFYRPDYCTYPADVRAFIDDRDACVHFSGEWPDSASNDKWAVERRKFLTKSIRKYCKGTNQRLRKLKAAHAGNAHVLELLNGFDSDSVSGQ
jgi:hypothetical protein